MGNQLCGTNLTGHRLQQLLANSPQLPIGGHRLVHVEAKIIFENQGFTSKVFRVKLTWSEESSALPQSLVVKVIGGNTALGDVFPDMSKEAMDAFYAQIRQAHNVECAIYDFKGLRDVVPMPKCFAKRLSSDNEAGIIVLEDLCDEGLVLSIASWGLGYTNGQIDEVVKVLASLHAWSVNHTEWRRCAESAAFQRTGTSVGWSRRFKAKKALPEAFKDLDEEKVSKHIHKEKYLDLFGCDPKARYNVPLVLVHGDVQIMNMMFEKKANNTAGDRLVALLDWQVSHQGVTKVLRLRVVFWIPEFYYVYS